MSLLTGVRVIDFSKWLPGQYCGMLLGDYGADVVKIEDLQGDSTRRFFPEKEEGMSYWHMMLNRNKRGVALDIKQAAGRELLLKLLKDADVFLEGFRPGYLARYGLDYETVHAVNPRLIYVSITGFGQKSHKPAHDLNVVGLAGLNSLDGEGSACVSEIQVSALGSALNALSGIAINLYAREHGAPGQHLDVSLYATALGLQVSAASSLWGCEETGSKGFGRIAHYYNIYRTADGRWLTVGTIEPKFWAKFCELLGAPDLQPRQYDFAHKEELLGIVREKIAGKTLAQWLELIGGEEFCVTPVNNLSEALQSELTTTAELVTTAESDLGPLRYLLGPVKFSDATANITRRAPRLGEHTAEVMAELGYSAAEVAEIKASGAVK